MKRHGNHFDKIVSYDNLLAAHQFARKGKSYYEEVKAINSDPETYLLQLQKMLVENSFTTSPYKIEERFDGRKMRTISKLPYFPDRIVHHAIMNVVGDILTNSLIRDTFQSISGRGTFDARKRVAKLVRSKECPRYALKIDVQKFYPSVNNALMKVAIRKKIKCAKTLCLIDNIIDSHIGLPIGNYTSQIFGNVYLSEIDWYVKQNLCPVGYFRYCDDIVVFDHSKERLHEMRREIELRLGALKLSVKPNWNIYDVHTQGVDFVGYTFAPHSTRLRRSIAANFKRAAAQLRHKGSKIPLASRAAGVLAFRGWAKYASAKRLWRSHVRSDIIVSTDSLFVNQNPLRYPL